MHHVGEGACFGMLQIPDQPWFETHAEDGWARITNALERLWQLLWSGNAKYLTLALLVLLVIILARRRS